MTAGGAGSALRSPAVHFLTLPIHLGCHFSEGALRDRVQTMGDMRQIQDAFLNLRSQQQ